MLLDSMSTGGVGGQLAHVGLHSEHLSSAVLEGVLEGGECRRRSPQSLLSDGHLYSNLLRLAVHGNFHVVLVLGHFHSNPLGLGVRVLGGNGLGSARAVFTAFRFHSRLLNSSLGYSYAEVFLDPACHFLMMRMVQALELVVISVLLPIVKFLELVTRSHLVSILLEVSNL